MRSKESSVIWGGGVLVQTFWAHPLSLRGLGLYIHEPNHGSLGAGLSLQANNGKLAIRPGVEWTC